MIESIGLPLGYLTINGKVLLMLLWAFFVATPWVLWFLWGNFWHINISKYAELKHKHEKREFYIAYGVVNVIVFGIISSL